MTTEYYKIVESRHKHLIGKIYESVEMDGTHNCLLIDGKKLWFHEEFLEAAKEAERLLQEASVACQRLAALESLRDIPLAIKSLDRSIILWPGNTEAVEFRKILSRVTG